MKVHKPEQLPVRDLTEQQFEIWKLQLRAWLSSDETLAQFLPRGRYSTWQSEETNPDRITELVQPGPDPELPDNPTDPQIQDLLAKRRMQLEVFLSQVANCVSLNHYTTVVRHATSLQWIFNKIRQDYDIAQKGIHFMNLARLKYDSTTMTPSGFYQQYRAHIINHTARRGDIIQWNNNLELVADETIGPAFEDHILYCVINLIDPRLIEYVHSHYKLKLGVGQRIMDVRADLFVNIPKFITELDGQLSTIQTKTETESSSVSQFSQGTNSNQQTANTSAQPLYQAQQPTQAAAIQPAFSAMTVQSALTGLEQSAATLAAFARAQSQNSGGGGFNSARGRGRGFVQTRRLFCKSCYDADKGKSVYLSHNQTDSRCPIRVQLNALTDETYLYEVLENENAQVCSDNMQQTNCYLAGLRSTRPVAAQILSAVDSNNRPISIELDSAATLSFITLKEALDRNYKILPNNQVSQLGDGITTLKSYGEIDIYIYRNENKLRFRALVAKNLHCPAIGGTNFIRENDIRQDFTNNLISMLGNKCTVPSTSKEAIMPVTKIASAQHCSQPHIPEHTTRSESLKSESLKSDVRGPRIDSPKNKRLPLVTVKTNQILMPRDAIQCQVSVEDQDVVMEAFKGGDWPPPQIASIKDGKVEIINDTQSPVTFSEKKAVSIKMTPLTTIDSNAKVTEPPQLHASKVPDKLTDAETIDLIKFGKTEPKVKQMLDAAHRQNRQVFDKDLTGGYNHYFGKHICKLNWISLQRPEARKIPIANYDHDLKGVMQELCDELTQQGVLKIPQEHNILVQSVCPAFLQRKRRAADIPKHLLTKDDVRLLVNFGPINQHIKNIPSAMTTPDDVFNQLGRWKHIIILDLFNAFYQNHMHEDDQPYLGIMTPFGGLRVIARSGQGLIGQSEELDELMSKILKDEIKEGILAKIQDDLVVGGDTQTEAAHNYIRVLVKLALANLRVEPKKVNIFPETATIAGWDWRTGSYLSVSPHRMNSLKNIKEENIRKVHHMRSFLGLFKTLQMATPAVSRVLAPLEEAVAGRDSKEDIDWNRSLSQRFREAKSHVRNVHTIYLPHPNDQLVIKTDAASHGIGHTIYAVKEGQLVPVRFHSSRLKPQCSKWQACELEGLSVATAIQSEYNLLRESKHPIIVLADSKPVSDAIRNIQEGKFSTSARMNRLLTNINKLPIIAKHVSAKFNLNQAADIQSRHTPVCNTDVCSIHRFIDEVSNTIVDPAARCSAIQDDRSFDNRIAWKAAQQNSDSCKAAVAYLISGKVPHSKAGDQHNETRHYVRHATLAPDGLLVTDGDSHTFTIGENKKKIVVPHNVAPGLLHHLHNRATNPHPPMAQLKALFNRSFYTWNLQTILDSLYQGCYYCSVIQRQPVVTTASQSVAQVEHPHRQFHIDIIRRNGQYIMLIVDHFTNYIHGRLVPSEKAADLRDGVIALTTPIRHPGPIKVTTDSATGFQALEKEKDGHLAKLQIEIITGDEFNKNFNAIVDKSCQELEAELRKIQPEGGKVDDAAISRAVLAVNSKLRRKEAVAAYEMHTARQLETGVNLKLDDKSLRRSQMTARRHGDDVQSRVKIPQPGDTVTNISAQPKHQARDMYLVTASDTDRVVAQKILHTLSENKAQIRSKEYITHPKHLRILSQPARPGESGIKEPALPPKAKVTAKAWNPIPQAFWEEDSDSEDDEDVRVPDRVVLPVVQEPVLIQDEVADESGSEYGSSSVSGSGGSLVGDAVDENVTGLLEQEAEEQDIDTVVPELDPGEVDIPGEQAVAYPAIVEDIEDDAGEVMDNILEEFDPLVGVQGAEVPQMEEMTVEQVLERYVVDQSRRPKKNDVISYFDTQMQEWVRVKIIGSQKPTSVHKDYFNIRFIDLDRDDEGIYLYTGSCWTIGEPVIRQEGQPGTGEDDSQVEDPGQGRALSLADLSRVVSDSFCCERSEEHVGEAGDVSVQEDMEGMFEDVDFILRGPSGVRQGQLHDVIQPGVVYSLPEVPVQPPSPEYESRVLRRARRLRLPPEQESMRLDIARGLVTRRVRSPRVKSKAGLLGRLFKGI